MAKEAKTPENAPKENQPQTGALNTGAASGFFTRLAGRLPAGWRRYAGIALVVAFALLIVGVMRNYAAGVEAARQEQLFATAQALALPTINAVTGGGCTPTAVSYASWVTNVNVVGSDVNYEVLANVTPTPRVGTIQVGDKTFTITQQGNTCGYSLNAYGAKFSQPGGAGNVLASTTGVSCPTTHGTDQPPVRVRLAVLHARRVP